MQNYIEFIKSLDDISIIFLVKMSSIQANMVIISGLNAIHINNVKYVISSFIHFSFIFFANLINYILNIDYKW